MELKLDIGGGTNPVEGYVSIDRKLGLEAYPLKYEDGTVDEIRASHVLEHFSHREVGDVIADWVRVLLPGGCLKIAVPDFLKITKDYQAGIPINVQGYVMGAHIDENDHHACIWDEETLRESLVNAGLERIGHWNSEIKDCATLEHSCNLKGFKPHPGVYRKPGGTVGVLASARFGPTLHHECAYAAFWGAGIPYNVYSGCFWNEILSEQMEKQLEDPGVEYLITGDFDTIFQSTDVMELCRLMRAYPEADAIAPLQMKRSGKAPLFTIRNEDGSMKREMYAADFDRNLTKVNTAHFGLTIFRAQKLRDLPRPWMVAKPNSDEGRWRGNKIDADIDFWFNWAKAGNSIFLANRVVVGHMVELIMWPADDGTPIYQGLNDYAENGIPAEAKR